MNSVVHGRFAVSAIVFSRVTYSRRAGFAGGTLTKPLRSVSRSVSDGASFLGGRSIHDDNLLSVEFPANGSDQPALGVVQRVWNWLRTGWGTCALIIAMIIGATMNVPTAATQSPMPSFASVTTSRPAGPIRQVLLYKLQKVFAMNALAKVCAVVSFAVPLIFVSAYVYKVVTGASLKSAMFKTYTILQDTPGADACSEDSPTALLVTNFTHILGLFTYAIVLGVVIDDVSSTVSEFKRGNTTLYESGHTVILNNNRHTAPLLKQWATAQKESGRSGGAIVVLADMPKEDLDVLVNEVRGETGMDVMGREGRPYDIADLNLVSAGTANTIILMDPLQDTAWDDKMAPPHAATLVSLAAIGASPANGQTLVVQVPNSLAGADVLQSAGRLHESGGLGVVDVRGLEALSELQAQCAVQPGLASFHNQVFMPSAQGSEFYVRAFESLEGKTYQEARRAFKNATLVGCSSPSAGLVLNPPDSYVIQKGDEMVGLTQSAKSFEPKTSSLKEITAKLKEPEAVPEKGARSWSSPRRNVPEHCNKNIVVLCFDTPAPQVTRGLEDFLPQGAKVTYVSAGDVDLPHGRFKARHVTGSPASNQTLLDAGVGTADSVIITGVDDWEATNANIQILSSIAQLTDICSSLDHTKPLHVVAQARGGDVENFTDALASIKSHSAAAPQVTTDILFTDNLVAGILTQSAMEPKLAPVITDILDAKGNRVTLRSPQHYMDAGETLTMAELEDRVRLLQDTVVGYYAHDGTAVCSFPKSTPINVADVRHFIVISDTIKM